MTEVVCRGLGIDPARYGLGPELPKPPEPTDYYLTNPDSQAEGETMKASEVWSVLYDLDRLASQIQDLEADIVLKKKRLEAMEAQALSLARSLEPTLTRLGSGQMIGTKAIAAWIDDEGDIQYQRIIDPYDLARLILETEPEEEDDEQHDDPTAKPAAITLTDEQLSELAFQQAVRDFTNGEDSDIDALANGVAGLIVP